MSSPILDTVPSKFSEDAIEKKIDEILEKKLSHLPTDLDLLTRIENMERLLRLQQSASIADHSPIPTGEPSPLPPSPSLPPDEPVQPAIETVTPEVSPSPPSPPGTDAIEDSEKKIMEPVGGSDSLDTLPVPPITDKTIDQNAIEDLTDRANSPAKKKGLTDSELARHLGIDKSNITRWKQKGEPTQKYRDKWELRGRFWYEKD